LENKELLALIEDLKRELDRLISSEAGFDEIYNISTKLDKYIVLLLRIQSRIKAAH
jgi:hypothetical protein